MLQENRINAMLKQQLRKNVEYEYLTISFWGPITIIRGVIFRDNTVDCIVPGKRMNALISLL